MALPNAMFMLYLSTTLFSFSAAQAPIGLPPSTNEPQPPAASPPMTSPVVMAMPMSSPPAQTPGPSTGSIPTMMSPGVAPGLPAFPPSPMGSSSALSPFSPGADSPVTSTKDSGAFVHGTSIFLLALVGGVALLVSTR